MTTASSTSPGCLGSGRICTQGRQSTYLDWCILVHLVIQAVLDGVARDERIDNMVGIMGDLHSYVADTYSIEKIASYKSTLRTLLVQTTECSYFIGDYRKVTQFSTCSHF